jgi:hypothetical protein
MIARFGEDRSDTFRASMWSRSTPLAGKAGNTHVVPP